jgi:hypothetical protein
MEIKHNPESEGNKILQDTPDDGKIEPSWIARYSLLQGGVWTIGPTTKRRGKIVDAHVTGRYERKGPPNIEAIKISTKSRERVIELAKSSGLRLEGPIHSEGPMGGGIYWEDYYKFEKDTPSKA